MVQENQTKWKYNIPFINVLLNRPVANLPSMACRQPSIHSLELSLFHRGPNNTNMFLTAVGNILINILVITNNKVLHYPCNKGDRHQR